METFLKTTTLLASALIAVPLIAQSAPSIPMAHIPAGTFTMGADDVTLPAAIINGFGVMSARPVHGDWDEDPAHSVTITHSFTIATHLITVEEFSNSIRPTKPSPLTLTTQRASATTRPSLSAHGSQKKLESPTGCPLKPSGNTQHVPASKHHTSPATHRHPPASPTRGASSWAKARQSGSPIGTRLMKPRANQSYRPTPRILSRRARRRPRFPKIEARRKLSRHGALLHALGESRQHRAQFRIEGGNIGFRVVQASSPSRIPHPRAVLFLDRRKADSYRRERRARSREPFYRTHELFPNLSGKSMPDVGWRLGLAPGLGINYHNSAVQVLANGDVVAAYYNTPDKEDDPDQTVMVMRRRAGSETWTCRSPGPLLPMQPAPRRSSGTITDISGSSLASPVSSARRHLHSPRPMTTAQPGRPFSFPTSPLPSVATSRSPSTPSCAQRTARLYPTDSTGRSAGGLSAASAVWATNNNGKTWYDTGGRTGGRHTTIVIARNGDLLGFGGKNSEIDGHMPLSIRSDGGIPWGLPPLPLTN